MSERKLVYRYLTYLDTYNTRLSELVEQIETIEKDYADWADLFVQLTDERVNVYGWRLETDLEHAQRIRREEDNRKRVEDKEHKDYARLKAKYEGSTLD